LSDRIGRKPQLIASCVGYAIFGYPLFVLASSGDVTNAFIAQLAMVVMLSAYAGACPATYSELFPTRIRYTALSIGYNTAVAVFGGFAPFIATWLIRETGNPLAAVVLCHHRRSHHVPGVDAGERNRVLSLEIGHDHPAEIRSAIAAE